MTEAPRPACQCGHSWEIHQHHRDGTDCSRCDPDRCWAYRRPLLSWAWSLVRAMAKRPAVSDPR